MVKWKVEELESIRDTGGVIKAFWKTEIKDENGITVSTGGEISLSPDPENPEFIEYESLTEEVVISWVKSLLDVESIESDLQRQYNEKIRPTVVRKAPWVDEE